MLTHIPQEQGTLADSASVAELAKSSGKFSLCPGLWPIRWATGLRVARSRPEGVGHRLRGRFHSSLSLTIEVGFVVLLLFAPLALGAVHEVSYTVLELGMFGLMMLWMVRLLVCGEGRSSRSPATRLPRSPDRGVDSATGLSQAAERSPRSPDRGDGSDSRPAPRVRQAGASLSRLLYQPRLYACAFLGFAAIQVMPLPRRIAGHISPGLIAFHDRFALAPLPWSEPLLTDSQAALPGGCIALSIYPYRTHNELFKAVAYASAFLLVTGCLGGERPTRRLAYTVALIGTCVAALGLYQYFAWGNQIYGFWQSKFRGVSARACGPFVNSNHFANYLAMTAPLAFALCCSHLSGRPLSVERKARPKRRFTERPGMAIRSGGFQPVGSALLLVATFTIVAALFLSLSRGGVLAFLIATTVFVTLSVWQRRGRKARSVVLLALALVWTIGLHAGGRDLFARFDRVLDNPGAPGTRPVLWRQTMKICRDFPVLGVGLGCFENVFPLYKPQGMGDQEFIKAHNDYLHVFAEMGILGVSSLCAFLLSILGPAWRTVAATNMVRRTWMLVGLLASCAAVLVHSVVDFSLQIPANALLFSVILGLTYNATRHLRASNGGTHVGATDKHVLRPRTQSAPQSSSYSK